MNILVIVPVDKVNEHGEDKENLSVQDLQMRKDALKDVINRTLDEYDAELSELRKKYEPRLSSMVEDYRHLKSAVKCRTCAKFPSCGHRTTFDGFSES